VHPQAESYLGECESIGPRGVYDEATRLCEGTRDGRLAPTGCEHLHRANLRHLRSADAPTRWAGDPDVPPAGAERDARDVFGDGSQTRSFCYADDLIRGLVLLAESEVHEPVNLGNPAEMSLLEMAELIIECSEIVFESLPVDDPRVRQPDITRARQLLGWEPEVDLREGLRRTIEHYTAMDLAPALH
jgi:dTDP-glucose 4,6-dehydratase